MFENDDEMKLQFFPLQPVYYVVAKGNTGDGIRMAQQAGAKLWHMWHFHGAYGFRSADPAYPYAIRVKRLPRRKTVRELILEQRGVEQRAVMGALVQALRVAITMSRQRSA